LAGKGASPTDVIVKKVMKEFQAMAKGSNAKTPICRAGITT
jgi:hypothetical protein